MKLISFLTILLLCCFEARAQQFAGNTFTVNGKTYICEQYYGYTHIYNQQNLSRNRDPESHPKAYCVIARLDYPLVRAALHATFNETQRAGFTTNGTGLDIVFYIKPVTGQIDEVSFNVDKVTPITQQQIYQLEQGLKGLVMPQKPLCHPMTWIVCPLSVSWE